MVPIPTMQDSALTVLNHECDLSFGMSPLTLCTSEEPRETLICAENCFACCYQIPLNNVFHLLVLILRFRILFVQDPVLHTVGGDGVFFIFVSRYFQLLTKLL